MAQSASQELFRILGIRYAVTVNQKKITPIKLVKYKVLVVAYELKIEQLLELLPLYSLSENKVSSLILVPFPLPRNSAANSFKMFR